MVKSAGDPENVKSVLIDRIWLIQALDVGLLGELRAAGRARRGALQ